MTDLEALTADQLRVLYPRADARLRRAIARRLQQLDNQPAPNPAPARKAPAMHESEFRDSFRRLLPPTTRQWWSVDQITETLDRAMAERNSKGKQQ